MDDPEVVAGAESSTEHKPEVKPANHWFHFPLHVIGTAFCIYWYFYLPKSGKALLVLGALVAVMMLMDMRPVHKGIYVLIVLGLVLIENQALDKERADSAKEQSQARKEEADRFQKIADGIDGTLDAVKQTLINVKQTLINTTPRAIMAFQGMTPLEQHPQMFPNTPVPFNFYFNNEGNEVATNVIFDVQFYVDTIDNLEAQQRVSNKFERWWATAKHRNGESVLPSTPAEGRKFTTVSPIFTKEQISGLMNHTDTIYFLARFVYSDHSGRWATDVCNWYADVPHNLDVVLSCKPQFDRKRYLWARQSPGMKPLH